MFTPADAIAKLDAALALTGQTVTVRRGAAQATVKAMVRGYAPNELVGNINQSDRRVILSPTGLEGLGGAPNGVVTIDGKPHAIQGTPGMIKMADVLVRIELSVRG